MSSSDNANSAPTSPDALVLLGVSEGVATLTLNRPGKLNALTPELLDILDEHLAGLEKNTTVHCLVLTGAGRSFCAGHDLDALDEQPGQAEREAAIIDRLENFPHPTIAKIRGHCLTGGLELVLACDLLVAAESAKLADTHTKWGLVPIWGMSVRLPERIGHPKAKELTFTGLIVDGRTAADIGLVDRCTTDGQLDIEVDELTAQIVANSAGANRICKQLYARSAQLPRSEALATERLRPFGMPTDTAERLARR